MPPAPLPAPPAEPLVGRDDDERRLRALLQTERWVCLTGPAGVGKSRLAHSAAWAVREGFAGGVHRVDAQDADSPSALALLSPTPGSADAGPRLWVLDGADALTGALPDIVRGLLAGDAAHRVIVTSRERTSAPDEAAMSLGPLGAPAARALLARRLQRHDAHPAAGEASDALADAILSAADGLPLAIELFAAQRLVLGPAALQQHVQDPDARLDADVRGRSLRQTLSRGLSLLPAPQQGLLAALSVFVRWFDFADAAAVTGATLADLRTLCERSWLVPSQEAQVRRFRLLRPVRDLVSQMPVPPDVAEGHRAHFMQKASAGPDQAVGENLLAAAAAALGAGRAHHAIDALVAAGQTVLSQGPVHKTLRLLQAAWPSSPTAEARLLLGQLLRLDGQLDSADAVLEAVGPGETCAAEVWTERADIARQQDRPGDATTLYAKAVDLADRPGPALERWAGLLFERGQIVESQARYVEAADAHRAAADERGLARVAHSLGCVAQEAKDFAAAAEHFREAAERHRALGDQRFCAIARFDLGALLLENGTDRAALAELQEAVRALDDIGDRRQAALGRALMGVAQARLGDRNQAEALLADAESEMRRAEDAPFLRAVCVHAAHLGGELPAGPCRSDEERYALRVLQLCQAEDANTLCIEDEAQRLRVGTDPPVAIKAKAARHILLALADARQAGAAALTPAELIRKGWPGQRLVDTAAKNRLQVALSALRKAGLGDRLVRTDDGYQLDDQLRVRRT